MDSWCLRVEAGRGTMKETHAEQYALFSCEPHFSSLPGRLKQDQLSDPWLHPRITWKVENPDASLPQSYLIGLGCSLGVKIFQTFSHDSKAQMRLSFVRKVVTLYFEGVWVIA